MIGSKLMGGKPFLPGICLLLVQSYFGMPAAADGLGDMNAERPGFTTASAPVGLGVLQLEQGFTYEWARLEGAGFGTRFGTISVPQDVLRFGITSGLELRFSTVGYSIQSVKSVAGSGRVWGPNDYIFGAKARLLKQHDIMPEISVIGGLSFPFQRSAFTSAGHDPSFTIAATKDLPRKLSVIANVDLASLSDTRGRIFSSSETLWLTRSMRHASPFGEVFHTTIGRGLGSEVVAAAGFYRMFGKHVQIDAEAGHTFTGVRPSLYASLGLVIRVPEPLLGPERFRIHKN